MGWAAGVVPAVSRSGKGANASFTPDVFSSAAAKFACAGACGTCSRARASRAACWAAIRVALGRRNRDLSSPAKFALGLFFAALGFGIMIYAAMS